MRAEESPLEGPPPPPPLRVRVYCGVEETGFLKKRAYYVREERRRRWLGPKRGLPTVPTSDGEKGGDVLAPPIGTGLKERDLPIYGAPSSTTEFCRVY